MDDDRYQKELFEFEEPKRHFSKLVKMLPKPDFEGKVAVTLTLEKMVFISIGIVMIMVIVYAIGVESGKARKVQAPAVPSQTVTPKALAVAPAPEKAVQPNATVIPAMARQPASASQRSFLNTAPAVTNAKAPEGKAAAVSAAPSTVILPGSGNLYMIVAAAFSKKETAQSGAALLGKEGTPAFVYYSEPFYLICVGSYADKNGTQIQRDLAKIKRVYKDAYVKLR